MTIEMLEAIAPNGKWLILLPILLMGFDVISGFLAAMKNRKLKSSKMREGFFKKFANLILILTAIVLTYATGLSNTLLTFVVLYVCITELLSLVENVTELGLKLPKFITNPLAIAKDVIDKGE